MLYFLILSLIALICIFVLTLTAIKKNYNVHIKNKLLGEVKLEKN